MTPTAASRCLSGASGGLAERSALTGGDTKPRFEDCALMAVASPSVLTGGRGDPPRDRNIRADLALGSSMLSCIGESDALANGTGARRSAASDKHCGDLV